MLSFYIPGVEGGFAGLGVLVFAGDVVLTAILDEIGACLVEGERYTGREALGVEVEYPVVVQGVCIFARFASHRDILDQLRVEVCRQVYSLEHRRDHNQAMAYGQREEYWEPVVGAVLVLDRTSDGHMAVAFAPVGGQTVGEAFDALGEEKESAVVTAPDDVPDCTAPSVGLFDEEIRGEA